MLELKDVSLHAGEAPDAPPILAEVSVRFPKKHFVAVLGPSGCGKSTLLKVIAGLHEPSQGQLLWSGRDLAVEDMDPHEIGYVPQFSIAYELLTVRENLESALALRVSGLSGDEREKKIDEVLQEVGLHEIADRRVKVLSGGQRRRLALALEMVSSPRLLLCDEVTSGLDPKAEDEIARLMHQLAERGDRVVLSVTHSLRHLALYDSVLVLYQGRVAYHGPADLLFHYFGVERPEELFPRLAQRQPDEWHTSWDKHRAAYYASPGLAVAEITDEVMLDQIEEVAPVDEAHRRMEDLIKRGRRERGQEEKPAEPETPAEEAAPSEPAALDREVLTPSAISQFFVLLGRRWKLFFRHRAQVGLQLALLFGFPILVVVFALDGLPQLKSLDGLGGANLLEQLQNQFSQEAELMRAGSLVSGLIMFQVILLALMGANNSAREIAAERLIFEKEKFAGLHASAYVASKAAFLGVLVFAQSIWMTLFVHFIVRFPGSLGEQMLLLTLVNAALTSVCLGISSLMKTAEDASLVSIYLVGFQLPLSGAVLALPSALGWITRPFIASYWGWSGFVHTLRDTRFYEAVLKVTQTHLTAVPLCIWVLIFHVVLGLVIAYAGCKSSRWD